MLNRIQTFRKINFPAALTLMVASLVFGASAGADAFTVTNPPSTQKVLPETGDAGPVADVLRIARS